MLLQISELMKFFDKFVGLNVVCYVSWYLEFILENVKQVLFVFKGDVYIGFNVEDFGEDDFVFVQDYLCMFFGFYGVLCLFDFMQFY